MALGRGVIIEHVISGSAADEVGVKAGDVLISVNGQKMRDLIDYMFARHDNVLDMVFQREGNRYEVEFEFEEFEDPGLELKHFKVKTCRNKCVFCFVSQLPKGLRKTLYLKDEDYRMSFLYGNYVTLANITDAERKRIISQHLSPLYVSVHSTNPEVRKRLLCNEKAPDIMKELGYLRKNKIRMHTQIVLCPGHNDGAELKRTIRELYSLHPYVLSVAVVPVGLTNYSKNTIKPMQKEDAEKALLIVETFAKRFVKKHGDPIVYASDELFIKAAQPFPKLSEYGDLPQLENGVGMVPSFQAEARKLKVEEVKSKGKFVTFAGESFYPYLKKFIDKLRKKGHDIKAIPVENTFFGTSVTVTGLISGRDVIKTFTDRVDDFDVLLLPDIVLRDGHDVLLDDVSVPDIEKALKIKIVVIESTATGVLEALEN